MEALASPVLLYAAVAVGGLGVALALPRPRISPQLIGALVAAIGLGGAFLALALKAGDELPGIYFYVFALIALGSALRVISHPKPVYAALFFILTIISSSAMYLMLQAEFLAFALIIIYAGAILITYLFVIMLAEQAPSEDELGSTSPYDRYSREPIAATIVGFVLLATLTGLMARGVGQLDPAPSRGQGASVLERLPRMVVEGVGRVGVLEPRGGLARPALPEVAERLDGEARTIRLTIADAEKFKASLDDPRVVAMVGGPEKVEALRQSAASGQEITLGLPADLRDENIHGVGFALIAEHPMALELAGVILLMAMLGAVVLARKQIEMGEAEKAAAAMARSNPRTPA